MRRENRPKLTFTVHLVSLSYISKTQYIVNSENHEIGYLISFLFFALAIITLYKYLKTKLHCYLIHYIFIVIVF